MKNGNRSSTDIDIIIGKRNQANESGWIVFTQVDGDLAEVSGAMQGGFRQKKGRAGFHEKELLKDLKELENTSSELSLFDERVIPL